MEKFEDNLTFEDIINQTFKKVKVGSTITGTIVEINGKGEIFVDIGYKADGIIPRNEYFSEKGLEPADEYKVGDKIKADVLKLGHHGSKTSSTENFIKQVQPKHGIISCGVKNQFKHPNREVLETLEQQQVKVYRTDQEGMIRYEWAFLSRYPKVLTSKEG